MAKMEKFTDIGQYRNVIKDVCHDAQFKGVDADGNLIMDRNVILPTIKFKGTVKLHGTNAAVAMDSNGEMWYQSRSNIITPTHDNAGFAFFAECNKKVFADIIADIAATQNLTNETIVIFGEWCAGNIQKGVAISGLDKMFVIFAVKVSTETEEDNYYLHEDVWKKYSAPECKIYNINDFETYTVDIDFNNPELSRNEMIDIMANVEKECPVGKAFGRKYGEDNTTGEGNVWVGWYNGRRYIFKIKGEKHSVTKVKTLAPVDVEKISSINSFVEYALTENRLNQGIEQVFTTQSKVPDQKYTGDFLKWIVNDIIKEELDTLNTNNLEPKEVTKYISNEARKWYFNYLESI